MPLARGVVLVIAVLVAAWFGLGVRQAHELGRAAGIVSHGSVSPSQAKAASDALTAAGVLNPDQAVQVLRGRLALDLGDDARAREILTGVTSSEPQNLDAWLWYARASVHDVAAQYIALARLKRLVRVFPARR